MVFQSEVQGLVKAIDALPDVQGCLDGRGSQLKAITRMLQLEGSIVMHDIAAEGSWVREWFLFLCFFEGGTGRFYIRALLCHPLMHRMFS
jgi:hypothetical protein